MSETDEQSGHGAYEPLREPAPLPRRRGRDLITGVSLLPEQRLLAFSDEQLEMVVEHWLYEALPGQYAHVVAYGGAGDKGRDRVGFDGEIGSDPWDNYQCKQYAKKLQPSDLWFDLGKLVYYVTRGDFTRPRRYAFVAPKGIGPKALDVLADPERIRQGLTDNWKNYCSSLGTFEEVQEALGTFVFPEFVPITAGQIIDDLKETAKFAYFFGGGLTKARPTDTQPPDEIAEHEMPYIEQLLAAYDDHCDKPVSSVDVALGTDPYGGHLRDSRRDFYCAESLREFSKDAVPHPETFTDLQQLMRDGIKFTVARAHDSGYDRVLATCETAVSVQLGDHPLEPTVTPADRAGICHQLANDGQVSWVP